MPSELNHIRSVHRAVSVLKTFTARQHELSGAEVARLTGLSVTTTHRLLACLMKDGLLSRNEKTLKFTIGPEMFRIGSIFLFASNLVTAADPIVRELNEMTNEAISVAVRDQDYVTIILREESKFSVALIVHIGSILQAHATSVGKALLSELTDDEIDRLYPEALPRITSKTIQTRTELKRELGRIRVSGIAFSREEAAQGDVAIASLIRDTSGRAVASVAIGVPVFRLNKRKESILAELVSMAAGLISYRLGYQGKVVKDFAAVRAWWNVRKSIFKDE